MGYLRLGFFRVESDLGSGLFGIGPIRGQIYSGLDSGLSVVYIIFYFTLNVIILRNLNLKLRLEFSPVWLEKILV